MYPACIIKKNLLIFDLSYIQGPAFQEGNTQDDNKKTYHTAGCFENAPHGTLSMCALSEILASTILMLPSASCSRF